MRTKKGFTLTELLVVIAIIGILSSLVTVGVMAALRRAKIARIGMEMNQINMALEQYKNEFGEYPPDFSDDRAVIRHMKKRWPRYRFNDQKLYDIFNDAFTGCGVVNSGYDTQGRCRAAALAFWLGGFPNKDGKFCGFAADPEAPFGKDANDKVNDGFNTLNGNVILGVFDNKVFIELVVDKNIQITELNSNARVFCLVNDLGSGGKVPYVYFRGKAGGGREAYVYEVSGEYDAASLDFSTVAHLEWQALGRATVYARSGDPFGNSTDPLWYQPETYQLIHPGLDGVFGVDSGTDNTVTLPTNFKFHSRYFRSIDPDAVDNEIGQKDYDNITNFSNYGELQSILP